MNTTRPITIFTPSFADEDNTNAQNLTVKEIVARLPPDLFRVIMICGKTPDPRIATRQNTELVRWTDHHNALRLLWQCLSARPDIYFFPRWGPLDRAFFTLRKYFPIKPALVSYVVGTTNYFTGNGLPGRSIREADQVCANSHYVAAMVREKFGVNPAVLYDGVDRRFYGPRLNQTRPKSQPVVLYAGSFRSCKRAELVIEQAVRHPSVQFRLAGYGETEAHCRALCQEHTCRNVTFLGHLLPRTLADEMRGADIFFFPSINEGHPQVLLQAGACGLPIVAMNTYRPESVLHGQTGFLAETDLDLASCLALLLKNAALRCAMSEAAILHSRKFDWEQIVAQWIDIFQRVLVRRAGVAA